MVNQLKHLAEFQKILDAYTISEESKRVLTETELVLLVSPSAGGRNTIIRELLKTGEYHYIVSDTTRKPRTNDGIPEQNGREYWFRSEEDMLEDLRAGKFLEAAVIHGQQVSGISIRELEQAHVEQKIAIDEIEIVGTQNILQAKPDTLAIFVLPPNFEQWMHRLDGRGHLPTAEKQRRLQSAVVEFQAALERDYYQFVINDTIDHAIAQIQRLTHGKPSKTAQIDGARLARTLLEQTQAWIVASNKA